MPIPTPLHAVILPAPSEKLGRKPYYSGLVEATGDTTAAGLPLYGSLDGDVLIEVAPAMFVGKYTGKVLQVADRANPEATTVVTLAEPLPAGVRTP